MCVSKEDRRCRKLALAGNWVCREAEDGGGLSAPFEPRDCRDACLAARMAVGLPGGRDAAKPGP